MNDTPRAAKLPPDACPQCWKKPALCVCATLRPQNTRLHVLILQHPQEPDVDLGTARIANLTLENSTLRIGLSWPNLTAALGREAQPSRWCALYLGASKPPPPGQAAPPPSPVQFLDKKGVVVPAPPRGELDGIVVLDGTWSQAKTLWWRNAWLTKLRRVTLAPTRRSLYGRLRKEPRAEAVSTLEAVGQLLSFLGEPAPVEQALIGSFQALLDQARRPR